MATPLHFPEVNRGLTKPEGMTDEQCRELPVFTDGRNCISYWQLDEQELAQLVANGGKLWLGVVSGTTQPPVFVQVDNPISYSSGPMPEPLPEVSADMDQVLQIIAKKLPGVQITRLAELRLAYVRGGQLAVVKHLQPYEAYLQPYEAYLSA